MIKFKYYNKDLYYPVFIDHILYEVKGDILIKEQNEYLRSLKNQIGKI